MCAAFLTCVFPLRVSLPGVAVQLQNLQYQKIHLSRELQICLSYKGCEDLELLSEEDFEACTPEDQRGGPRGSHAYQLARLTAEMKKREEVIKSLKQQDLRRKLYQGKLQSQRKFLDGLMGCVENGHAALEPMRKEFTKTGPLPMLDSLTCDKAKLLPEPLYAIYQAAWTYDFNFREDTVVTIEGDVAAAHTFSKAQANMPTASQPMSPDSKKRRKRKGDERDDKEQESVTAPHPLTVHVKIPPVAGSKAPTLSLVFSYLHILQIVSVKHSVSPSLGSAEETGSVNPLTLHPLLCFLPLLLFLGRVAARHTAAMRNVPKLPRAIRFRSEPKAMGGPAAEGLGARRRRGFSTLPCATRSPGSHPEQRFRASSDAIFLCFRVLIVEALEIFAICAECVQASGKSCNPPKQRQCLKNRRIDG